MNKRGLLMTLMTAGIMVIIISFFVPSYEHIPQVSRTVVIQTRFKKANDFMLSLHESVIERSVRDASYYALLSLLEYVNDTQSPIEMQRDFSEVLVNGSIGGVDLGSLGIHHMENRNLKGKLGNISEMAREEMVLETYINVSGVNIFQSNKTGHEFIGVEVNVSIFLDSGIAIWNTSSSITTSLDIREFYDPYYLMNTQYANKIAFTDRKNWSISQVRNQISDINYTYEEYAPSFIMRFENNSNGSRCCGIESFVNANELGIGDEPWSYVDYCYYGHQCNHSKPGDKSIWNITGITSYVPNSDYYGFKLELYHIEKYNLTDNTDRRVVSES